MPTISFRVSEEEKQQLEREAKKNSKTLTDFIKCKLFEKRYEEKPITPKLLINKYKRNCMKCNKPIAIGEAFIWVGSNTGLCLDCYVKSLGDKALASKYLKMRELNLIIRELKEQANDLADIINEAKISQVIEELEKILKDLKEYYNSFKEELALKIIKELEEINKKLEELYIIHKIKMKKKKKESLTYV